MDRVYKEDIPSIRKDLEELKERFSNLGSRTDWRKLRVEPLLKHTKYLERLLLSPRFLKETSRLTRGVGMFHSDLVYLKDNVKALRTILLTEEKSQSGRLRTSAEPPVKQSSKRRHR